MYTDVWDCQGTAQGCKFVTGKLAHVLTRAMSMHMHSLLAVHDDHSSIDTCQGSTDVFTQRRILSLAVCDSASSLPATVVTVLVFVS